MTAFSINEPPGSATNPLTFTIESLDPAEAEIGSADVTLHVHGTGFKEGMQIVFNGGPEATTFVSDTELTTIVKPSTATTAGEYPVTVLAMGFTVDPPQMFAFTEPAAGGTRRGKHR